MSNPLSVSPRGEDGRLMADVELIAEKDMGEKENIAPCQKYVLRITLVGLSNS